MKDLEAKIVDLRPGKVVAFGGKLYSRCADCGDVVCLNKWIFGSLHICAEKDGPDEHA